MKDIEEVVQEFPELFGKEPWNIQVSLISFGFEMGKGWQDVVYKHLPELSKVVLEDKLTDFYIVQVKEKFGHLCVYSYNGNDRTRAIQHKMEQECDRTCNKCGRDGTFRQDHWLRVTCDECDNKQNAENNDIY